MRIRTSPFLMSLTFGAVVSIMLFLTAYGVAGEFSKYWLKDALNCLWVSGLGALTAASVIGACIKSVRWWLFPLSLAMQYFFTVFFIIMVFVGFDNVF